MYIVDHVYLVNQSIQSIGKGTLQGQTSKAEPLQAIGLLPSPPTTSRQTSYSVGLLVLHSMASHWA